MLRSPARVILSCIFLACTSFAAGEDPRVSFANEVAPVLVEQCLACHNARTAKGRFNLETFQALMKGGESGTAVDPGDGEFSNIVQLVEVGEMPKDGDPLPPAQVAILKRWIDEGAALDEGKPADRPLTSIVPKPPQPVAPEVYPGPIPVTALAFRPDGSLLAVSGYHEILLFDPADGRLARRIQRLAERIEGLAFSPDGSLLAAATSTPARLGEVLLFRVETGEIASNLAFAGDAFFDVAFSPDGSKLAAAGADRTVRIWNVHDGAELTRIEDHADWVTAVTFSPDGARLATASRDKTAKVFDADSGESLATFSGHEQPVSDVLFTPDGTRVVSCGKDRQVRLWNVDDVKQKKAVRLDGEGLSLTQAGPDKFACGSSDRTARLFDFEGDKKKTFEGRPDWSESVAATADGSRIAIGGHDGTIEIFTPDEKLLRTILAMPPK